jgi:hypothetical protein
MTILDASAISDPAIREVYCHDILEMSRRVQARFGLYPFLYDGPIEQMTGFYEFRPFQNEKKDISKMRRM